MVNSLYLLTIFAKNTLYMFGRILNTSDIKRFYASSSQHTLVGLNLILGTILIFRSIHFILIQVNLPQEEIPKILFPHFPNRRIAQNITGGNESC